MITNEEIGTMLGKCYSAAFMRTLLAKEVNAGLRGINAAPSVIKAWAIQYYHGRKLNVTELREIKRMIKRGLDATLGCTTCACCNGKCYNCVKGRIYGVTLT